MFGGYESDLPEDDPLEPPSDDEWGVEGVCEDVQQADSEFEDGGEEEPARKRQHRKLDIPAREARRQKKTNRRKDLARALKSIDKKIKSRKTQWNGGEHGLEAMRARAIRSYLQLVLKGMNGLPASEIAAQSSNLAKTSGG